MKLIDPTDAGVPGGVAAVLILSYLLLAAVAILSVAAIILTSFAAHPLLGLFVTVAVPVAVIYTVGVER